MSKSEKETPTEFRYPAFVSLNPPKDHMMKELLYKTKLICKYTYVFITLITQFT